MTLHTGQEDTQSTKNESNFLILHIPAGLPSGRDLRELLTIVESSLAWSHIAIVAETGEQLRKHYEELDRGEEKVAASRESSQWNREVFYPITESFIQFLTRRHKPLIHEARAWGGVPLGLDIPRLIRLLGHLVESQENRRDLGRDLRIILHELYENSEWYSPEQMTRHFVQSRGLEGAEFDINDFSDWIGEEFGRELLLTKKINPDASLEIVFDIAAVLSMVTCQANPAAKDLIVYTSTVLKAYMGKAKKPKPAMGMAQPRLPPSMIQLMGKYSDVTLDWDGNKARLSLKLRRNHHK